MKAFVITLMGSEYSRNAADRCCRSATKHGVRTEIREAFDRVTGPEYMKSEGLEWTWANDGSMCKRGSGLKQHDYGYKDVNAKIACSMSHYKLWQECARQGDDYLILEHDAVFVRDMPIVDFRAVCMINNPFGATPRGLLWSGKMKQGVNPKTVIFPDDRPDGLAGNSAYLIKPLAAQRLVAFVNIYGVWPNDAIMCRQLMPHLEELYPWVTVVKQGRSTTCS